MASESRHWASSATAQEDGLHALLDRGAPVIDAGPPFVLDKVRCETIDSKGHLVDASPA